jgi:hypothetical protein
MRRWLLMWLCLFVCLTGYERNYHWPSFSEIFVHKWGRVIGNPQVMTHLPALFADLDARLAESTKVFDMPKVNAVAAGQPVSYFGMLPGMMVYNKFAYRTMPATISFAAWNPWIIGKDTEFFRPDDTAPRYVIYDLESPDNRLAAQDDYDIALVEKGNFLLERRLNAPEPVITPEIPAQRYKTKEWVNVPATENPTWMRIDIENNWLGKFFAAIYKPPEYSIEYVLDNGKSDTKKFIPGIARLGFMSAPLITNDIEFLAANVSGEYDLYKQGKSARLNRIVRFRIHCVHEKLGCGRSFSVAFDSVKNLTLGRLPKDKWVDLLGQFYNYGIKLIEMTSPSIYTRTDEGRPLMQCHAPCLMRIQKPEKAKATLTGVYGMFSTTFKSCTYTNGVHMVVTAALNGKPATKLFERILSPQDTPGDRGIIPLNIPLGYGAGEVTIDVDTRGESSCDQFFIDDLGLK